MSQTSKYPPTADADSNDTFTEIVQQQYGEPRDVLTLVTKSLSELAVGDGEVLIRVSKRAIHPGDVHILRGASNGGSSAPISPDIGRVPGFEGVGTVLRVGAKTDGAAPLNIGQRVIFFHGAARAWSTHVVVPVSAVFAIPDSISDDVAAQLLINSITALEMLRTGHNSLPSDAGKSPFVLITSAASSVNRLVAGIALGLGVRPILLVRSEEGAAKLRAKSPNVPVITSAATSWKHEIASVLDGAPLYCAFDAVGGAFLDEIASVLSDGGTIVSVGWQGEGAPDLSMFAPRGLAIKGVSLGRWGVNNDAEQRARHVETAIKLGVTSPELFEVEAQYELSDYLLAIDHVFRPGKSGVVILNS